MSERKLTKPIEKEANTLKKGQEITSDQVFEFIQNFLQEKDWSGEVSFSDRRLLGALGGFSGMTAKDIIESINKREKGAGE